LRYTIFEILNSFNWSNTIRDQTVVTYFKPEDKSRDSFRMSCFQVCIDMQLTYHPCLKHVSIIHINIQNTLIVRYSHGFLDEKKFSAPYIFFPFPAARWVFDYGYVCLNFRNAACILTNIDALTFGNVIFMLDWISLQLLINFSAINPVFGVPERYIFQYNEHK